MSVVVVAVVTIASARNQNLVNGILWWFIKFYDEKVALGSLGADKIPHSYYTQIQNATLQG